MDGVAEKVMVNEVYLIFFFNALNDLGINRDSTILNQHRKIELNSSFQTMI